MRYQNNSSILLQVQGCEFSCFCALTAKAPCQTGSQMVPCCSNCRSEVVCEVRHAWCWVLYAHSPGHKGDINFIGEKKKAWKEVSAVYRWEWDLFTFFPSFLPWRWTLPSTWRFWSCFYPQGRNGPLLALSFSVLFVEWRWWTMANNLARRRGEIQAWEFMWLLGQIDIMLQMGECWCGIDA